MNEKIVIITEAGKGLGKQATIKFAKEGHSIIMACKSVANNKEVREEIVKKTENHNIDLIALDIASFKSIEQFVNLFKSRYQVLDVLINNAEYIDLKQEDYPLSPDNINQSFATNAVGPLLLTCLLKDNFKKSLDPRVINVCSTSIRSFFDRERKIDFDNLKGEKPEDYDPLKMYTDSKMAELILTFKLSEVFMKDQIKINAIQIPTIETKKDSEKKMKSRVKALVKYALSPPEESIVENYYYLATSLKIREETGELFNTRKEIMKPAQNYDEINPVLHRRLYPRYAKEIGNKESIWKFSMDATKDYINTIN